MEFLYGLVIILILVILYYCFTSCSSERFSILGDFTGIYSLQPAFSPAIQANIATTLQIVAQRPYNPDYLDFIITYKNGKNKMVRTNFNEGTTWTYYNDYNNVQFLTDPTQIQYDLHANNGLFRALTVVVVNGQQQIKLLNYNITNKIS